MSRPRVLLPRKRRRCRRCRVPMRERVHFADARCGGAIPILRARTGASISPPVVSNSCRTVGRAEAGWTAEARRKWVKTLSLCPVGRATPRPRVDVRCRAAVSARVHTRCRWRRRDRILRRAPVVPEDRIWSRPGGGGPVVCSADPLFRLSANTRARSRTALCTSAAQPEDCARTRESKINTHAVHFAEDADSYDDVGTRCPRHRAFRLPYRSICTRDFGNCVRLFI